MKSNGVSGPVFFNIRPGIYTRNNGNNSVLVLDSIVSGLSETSRITFQPDQSSGGNVDNVILEMNRTNIFISNPALVLVNLDFVTFRNMTFRHVDSLNMFSNSLIRVENGIFNTVIDDFILDGCRFIGRPFGIQTGSGGTDLGISGNQQISRATITNNKFYDIRWGVSIENGAGPRAGTIIVEDNEVYGSFGGGTAIVVAAENASVRRNHVDMKGETATAGIGVFFSSVAFVEQNIVRNASGGTFTGIDIKGIFSVVPDSIVVANNIIIDNTGSTSTGISVTSANTKILNNTVINPPTWIVNGIVIHGENCSLINNIIINGDGEFFGVVLHLGNGTQSEGLVSDHNILFNQGIPGAAGDFIAIRGSESYATLENYQSATGFDLNSVSKQIDFISDSLGIYYDNCQVQDADLIGIPLPLVLFDYYGNTRDPVEPFKGAVEGFPVPYDMFAAPFKAGLPGTPFSITAGRFDNLLRDGLAVPDYDNNQILLYHNNGDRTFSHSGTLSTEFQPTVVKFFDLDADGNLDLIVGGEAEAVKVFWGNGIGGFPSDTILLIEGRVRSLEIGRENFFNRKTIFLSVDNGFLPNSGFLRYIINDDGWDLAVGIVQRPGPCCFNPDTISSVITDLAIGNLDADQDDEIAALSINIPSRMYIFNDTIADGGGGFLTYGTHYEYSPGTHSYPGHISNIIMEDFDGDNDLDLISTGASSASLIFLKNEGDFSFSSEEIPTNNTFGLVSLDYENDDDPDFVSVNDPMDLKGLTVFLNDGTGNFTSKEQCFFPFASGYPYGVVASDFDLDGRTDIAVVSAFDSLFVLYNLGGGLTGINDETYSEIPNDFSLSQNYPNPFNPSTTIRFSMFQKGHVFLKVYDILGKEIAILINEEKNPGEYQVEFNAGSLSSGVYFYQLTIGNYSEVKKMILLK